VTGGPTIRSPPPSWSPGLAGDPPAWFGQAGDVPRAVHAGPWIAQPGQFFEGWGRRAGPAVHTQHAAGGAAAVAAGVDSLEHGMGLDPGLLPSMAERAIALTPTLRAMTGSLEAARRGPDGPRKDWYLAGAAVHPALVAAAAEAGVRILAGTDSRPHGRVADEIRALASAGLRPQDAIAADAVVYDADPRTDLAQLDAPRAVILRGQLVHRRP
jgi:imidazolonepropionase-like amidohydrolase